MPETWGYASITPTPLSAIQAIDNKRKNTVLTLLWQYGTCV